MPNEVLHETKQNAQCQRDHDLDHNGVDDSLNKITEFPNKVVENWEFGPINRGGVHFSKTFLPSCIVCRHGN